MEIEQVAVLLFIVGVVLVFIELGLQHRKMQQLREADRAALRSYYSSLYESEARRVTSAAEAERRRRGFVGREICAKYEPLFSEGVYLV